MQDISVLFKVITFELFLGMISTMLLYIIIANSFLIHSYYVLLGVHTLCLNQYVYSTAQQICRMLSPNTPYKHRR
jgi:hypothetical protein